jgi:hypothetical protein
MVFFRWRHRGTGHQSPEWREMGIEWNTNRKLT